MASEHLAVLDEHLDLIRSLRTPIGRRVTYRILRECLAAAPSGRRADELAAALDVSETCMVSAEMCAVIEHAAETLPRYELRDEDLPFGAAWVSLAEPWRIPTETDEVVASAVSWQADERRAQMWVRRRHLDPEVAAHSKSLGLPPIRLSWEGALPLGRPWDVDGSMPLAEETRQMMRRLVTLITLMGERVVVTERIPDRRIERRRRHARIPEDCGVSVIRLRRPLNIHEGADPGERSVDWSHRWIVRGHWREQWYPKEGRHRPRWIMPHVKGPEHAPLVVKDRVYRLDR